MMSKLFKLFILNIKLTLIKYLKLKKQPTGLEKALEKPDTFNPPENENFERVYLEL